MGREKYWVIGTEERGRFRELQDPIIENGGTRTYNKETLHYWSGALCR
jgi:hypothetical protein